MPNNITASALTTSGSNTDATSYNTASITPKANKLVLAWVYTIAASTPNTPTASGNGLTWVEVDNQADSSGLRKITLFRARGSSPSAGAVTFDFGGQTQTGCAWSIVEYDVTDTSGTNGSGAIVQAVKAASGGNATSLEITLAAFASTDNATVGGFGIPLNTASQPAAGTGFTQTGQRNQSTPNLSIGSEFRNDNDTTVDMTSGAASIPWVGIAAELKQSSTVVCNNLVQGSSTTAGTSYTTASATFTANRLYIATVHSRRSDSVQPLPPTLTTSGLTWVQMDTAAYDNAGSSRRTATTYRAMPASTTTGTTSIDFGAASQISAVWVIDELIVTDTSGTNGSGAIVQSATTNNTSVTESNTVTLGSFSSTGNATYSSFATGGPRTITTGSGFTAVGIASSSDSLGQVYSQFRNDNDTTSDISWTTATENAGFSYEIKVDAPPPAPSLKLLPLGDSITKGADATHEMGYRRELQDLLGIGTYDFVGPFSNPASDATYDVHHAGVSGHTTDEIEARTDTTLDTYMTNLLDGSCVLLCAGTNDCNDNIGTIASWVDNVEDIIDLIDAHDSTIDVYVALVPPADDATINGRIQTFNGLLETMLETYQGTKANLYIVDMYAAFTANANWADDYMFDMLHPNDAGYEVMADEWYAAILAATSVTVDSPTATTTLTTFTPTITSTDNQSVSVPLSELTLTGVSPSVSVTNDISIEAPVAEQTLTTQNPTISTTANVLVSTPVSEVDLSIFAPVITASNNQSVAVPVAEVESTSFTPSITVSEVISVSAPAGSLELTTQTPSISTTENVLISPEVSTLTSTPNTPTVSLSDNKLLSVDSASLTLSSFTPSITASDTIEVSVPEAELLLTVNTPSIATTNNKRISLDTVELTTATFAPSISTGGNVVVRVPTTQLGGTEKFIYVDGKLAMNIFSNHYIQL